MQLVMSALCTLWFSALICEKPSEKTGIRLVWPQKIACKNVVRYHWIVEFGLQPMKFHASDIQLSSMGGEYFQVDFSESEQEDGAYVLLQNDFEFFRGPAYFECHELDLAGQGRVKRCELRPTSLEIDLTSSSDHITVTFTETDEKIGNLAWMLRIILGKYVWFMNSSGISEIPMEDEEDTKYF